MKKTTALLVLLFIAGCSSPPSDEVVKQIIRYDMKKAVPISIIGNMLRGNLEELEEIDIEKVEKKTWKPNIVGKAVGMKAYDYWLVTASVKGTGRLKDPFGLKGELRGFHARYTWGVKQNEEGVWIILTNDFTQKSLEQPANPSWWVIKDDKIEKMRDLSTRTVAEKKDDSSANTVASQDIRALEAALKLYRLDNRTYPTTEQGLKSLLEKQLIDRLPKDPWQQPYQYRNPGKKGSIDIYSLGPDQVSSDDDIGNWRMQ